MVGVDRLQALATAHGASTTSRQVPVGTTLLHWIHWPQAPAAFALAIGISYISLCVGSRHKGRPFGSKKAATRSIMLIIATALLAAVLSWAVPHLPFLYKSSTTALLCGAVLKESEAIQELRLANDVLAAFVTLGISLLLGRVRDQISSDRADWCDHLVDQFRRRNAVGKENERASLDSFSAAAVQLDSGLMSRLPKEHADRDKAEEYFSAVIKAIGSAVPAYNQKEGLVFGKKYIEAEVALKFLLQIVYDWKYENIIDLEMVANPPSRLKAVATSLTISTDDDHSCLLITVSAHLPDRLLGLPDRLGKAAARENDPGSSGLSVPLSASEPGRQASSRRESSSLGTSSHPAGHPGPHTRCQGMQGDVLVPGQDL